MRTLKLITKDVVVEGKSICLKSSDLLSGALDNYKEGLKGIKNIAIMLNIYNKIESATDILELEDTEYELLYKAIDECQWSPMILRFGEFFQGLKD